jgi:hypothetical protein
MKRNRKVTHVLLKISQKDESFFLGLVSAEPDYKLSLAINKKFGISLKNITPVLLADETGSDLTFSRFSDTGRTKETAFTLVTNRSGNNFLIKKLNNIDYIFQVHDTENAENIEKIIAALKEIELINAVFNIDLNSLKDKNLQFLTL